MTDPNLLVRVFHAKENETCADSGATLDSQGHITPFVKALQSSRIPICVAAKVLPWEHLSQGQRHSTSKGCIKVDSSHNERQAIEQFWEMGKVIVERHDVLDYAMKFTIKTGKQ
jgi:hypothetical protein